VQSPTNDSQEVGTREEKQSRPSLRLVPEAKHKETRCFNSILAIATVYHMFVCPERLLSCRLPPHFLMILIPESLLRYSKPLSPTRYLRIESIGKLHFEPCPATGGATNMI